MPEVQLTAFDYVAFGAMAIVFLFLIWVVIWLGDMPANIAKGRNHPQVASVRSLAWFGLVLSFGAGPYGSVLWILAFAWAYYDYGQVPSSGSDGPPEAGAATSKEVSTP